MAYTRRCPIAFVPFSALSDHECDVVVLFLGAEVAHIREDRLHHCIGRETPMPVSD